MEESTWELSKENIQPLKQGRQPKILSTALRCTSGNVPSDCQQNVDGSTNSSATIRTLLLQQEKQEFEESLKTCMTSPDPLGVYYRYIRWMEETHPSGKDKEIRELVNSCLKSLKDQRWVEKYSNDIRWLYVWLKFASYSRTMGSLAVYEHMRNNDHCTRLAGLYLQWSGELETARQFDEAAKIFQSGIRNEAEPLHSLVTAYEEFQIRCARRLVSEQKSELNDNDDATRNVLGVLKAAKPSKSAGFTATPHLRLSTTEQVRCSVAQVGRNEASGGDGFTIYDDSKENGAGHYSDANKKTRASEIPLENVYCKENLLSADVWTKGSLKQRTMASAVSSNKHHNGEFAIYVDNSSSAAPANASDFACDARKSVAPQMKSSSRLVDDKCVLACCFEKLYEGGYEMSFEELRAARFQTMETNSSKLVVAGSNGYTTQKPAPSVIGGRPALAAIADPPAPIDAHIIAGAHSSPFTKAAVSPSGNGSFTQNIYREAMAAFSNTLHLSNIGRTSETDTANRRSAYSNNNQSNAGVFAIYEDPADNIQKEEADKENIDPKPRPASTKGGVGGERKRRNVAGILCESTEFVCFDENKNAEDVIIVVEDDNGGGGDVEETSARIPAVPAGPTNDWTTTNCTTALFDFNETTVAGLHRLLAPTADRAFSTPCHNGSRIQPLSLSMHHKRSGDPAESDLHTDENHPVVIVSGAAAADIAAKNSGGDGESCNGSQQKVYTLPTTLRSPSTTSKKLSTIPETSQEEYRSASSSSSAATTSSGYARRQLLSGSSGSCVMPSISEGAAAKRTALAFTTTPYSGGSLASELSGGKEFGTEYRAYSGGVQKPDAVRKLLLSDGEEGEERMDDTGHIEKPTIQCHSINPWTPAFVAYQLTNMPRLLESYPNFHTFDETLPKIQVGKHVCLGGETYEVISVAGEGAYAKVYKCQLEQLDSRNEAVVLKVQSPSCPLEFYVCQELRHRLKGRQLLNAVESGLTLFTDAYMFREGSILVTDYCPYGTLVDVVNVYKQITSEGGLPEAIVAYLTADILRILEAIHGQYVIHGDVKPDNFLVLSTPPLDSGSNGDDESRVRTVRLIDWGRSIDMALVPQSTTFTGRSCTSGFDCCEMQDGRPWTYQTDYYGMLGTVHILAFGEYMTTYKVGKTKTWRINRAFKRRWDDRIWREFFDAFLNIPDCSSLPPLAEWRKRFEEFVNICRTTRPRVWSSEIRKMQDVLGELKMGKANRKK